MFILECEDICVIGEVVLAVESPRFLRLEKRLRVEWVLEGALGDAVLALPTGPTDGLEGLEPKETCPLCAPLLF